MNVAMITRAHLITGSFGAGKTTAIRCLMAKKPAEELWVVILNEFTAAGLDALAVAQVAQGRYDVRLVAGGCLCCAAEMEFGKQLRDILRHLKPARLLIEPSGAAHAGGIVDELARYEAQGVLKLDAVICLVDPVDAVRIADSYSPADIERAQIQAADVLLLSKPDLADAAAHRAFAAIVAEQFPAKSFVGACSHGELPEAALASFARAPSFSLVAESDAATRRALAQRDFRVGGHLGIESEVTQLKFTAISWILPPALWFSRTALLPRLEWLLAAYDGTLRRVKGVLRTGPGPAWTFQSHGRGLVCGDSGYRRDSRLEIVVAAAPTGDFLEGWRAMLRAAETSR
jgi:G3E family GTPase